MGVEKLEKILWNSAAAATENPFNKNTHPYCHSGFQYALDVVAGKINACIYVRGACLRSLIEIPKKDHAKWIFDADRAERYLKLVQRFEHAKGHWSTPNIVYLPWQNWVWMNVQGFVVRETGFRRFRLAHIEVPRGNAKSTMASQAVLFDLSLDNPNGNKVSTAATKTKQARLVLDDARVMAKKNKNFLRKTGVEVRAHEILHPPSNSSAQALSAEGESLDGLNDILAVCDELHAMKREVFEVITSGMSKRRDSLTLCITTAGSDPESVGADQSYYAKQICLGVEQEDTVFAVVYTLDKGDDMWDEKNWIKANPGYGGSVDPETFRAKMKKALITPSDIPNLKIKHLNMWTDSIDAYFNQDLWDKCADPNMKIEDFKGKLAKVAIDLSSHIDLTARISIFKKDGLYYLFDEVFVPEGTVGTKDAHEKYEEWIDAGWLVKTPGNTINYANFQETLLKERNKYRISECAYDPWSAAEMAQRLSGKIEMIEFKQVTANLSEPMKKLDGLLRDGLLRHRGSPLMRWCLGNVVAKEDANENVFPRKAHKKMKIDPIVCAIMALGLWVQDEQKESVYATRGIVKI